MLIKHPVFAERNILLKDFFLFFFFFFCLNIIYIWVYMSTSLIEKNFHKHNAHTYFDIHIQTHMHTAINIFKYAKHRYMHSWTYILPYSHVYIQMIKLTKIHQACTQKHVYTDSHVHRCAERDGCCRQKWNQTAEFKSGTKLFTFHFALMPLFYVLTVKQPAKVKENPEFKQLYYT